MHRKEDDGRVSPHFLFHQLCLMNDRVKGWLYLRFGIAPCCVCACVREGTRGGETEGVPKKGNSAFFSHLVISEVKVNYDCQDVPRSTVRPKKPLTWVELRVEQVERMSHPQNALMYFSCQRAMGRSHSKSCCLRNEIISEVVHCPFRADPRTNLFHLLFLLVGGRWVG